MRIDYMLRFRRPAAAVLGAVVVGTLSFAATAHADEWDSTNREGIPVAMTRDRWATAATSATTSGWPSGPTLGTR